MRWLPWAPFILALLFVALPYDAQLWLLSGLRVVWLTPEGRSVACGALGATVGAAFWYVMGWNSLAAQLRREDYTKADKMYKERMR